MLDPLLIISMTTIKNLKNMERLKVRKIGGLLVDTLMECIYSDISNRQPYSSLI